MELPKLSTGQLIAGGSIAALGVGLGTAAVIRSRRKKSRKRKTNKYKNSRSYIRKGKRRRGRRYTPHTAGKRKDRSHKRIRYTKRGQPYIIMGNGRARFISLRSAKSSHKRKGGKY